MAKKNNIRSIRISDDILELIEAQAGENFTQKYEALITRCFYELPAVERRLEQLEQQIQMKRTQLTQISNQANAFAAAFRNMELNMQSLNRTISKAMEIES